MGIQLEPDWGSFFQSQASVRVWRSLLDYVLLVGASKRPLDIFLCAEFSGAAQALLFYTYDAWLHAASKSTSPRFCQVFLEFADLRKICITIMFM